MAKSDKRRKAMAEKKERKRKAMENPGQVSKYARKRDYCAKHGVWGFEVPEPKPWQPSQ